MDYGMVVSPPICAGIDSLTNLVEEWLVDGLPADLRLG